MPIQAKRAKPTADIAVPGFSKAGYAYETIRRKIIDGSYQPGDRLRLSELARQLEFSEMPIREALRLLQKDGLVLMHLHRGAEVARLSFEHGRDVTEVRMSLERVAVLAALPHHDEGSLAGLQRLLADMERAANNAVRFAIKNRAFCTALFEPCPNAFLRQQIEELWDQVWQASSTSLFDLMRQRVAETVEENRALLGYVQTRDRRRMITALDQRLRHTLAAWDGAIARATSHGPKPT